MMELAVAAWIGMALAPLGTGARMMSRSSGTETSRHTLEIYHGNWWATWHHPQDVWIHTAACAAAVLATLAGTAAVILGNL